MEDDDDDDDDELARIGEEKRESTRFEIRTLVGSACGRDSLRGESCLTTGIRCRRYFVVAHTL